MWGCGVRFIDGFLERSEGEGTMNSRDRHASCMSEFWLEKSLMVVTSLVVPLTKVGDEAVHKELGDRIERAATTASNLEAEQDNGAKRPYWGEGGVDSQTRIRVDTARHKLNTASIKTSENEEMEITATIDGRVKTVTEASIRRHLKLEDSNGISTLPNTKIFEQLALMGISKGYNGVDIPLFPTMLVQGPIYQGEGSTVLVESYHTPTVVPSTLPLHISLTLRSPIRQETKVPQLSSPPHTNVADEAASTGVDVRHGGAATTVTSLDAGQGSGNINKTPSMPHDSPLPRGHTLGSDEGRMQQNELMDLVTKLSDRCEALETDLRQTKKVYGDAFTRLIKKVKKLEKTVKTSQARRRSRVVISDDEEELEDPSKQGRSMIEEIDQDTGITLVQINAEDQVTPTKVSAQGEAHTQQDQPEDHLRVLSAAKVLADAARKRSEFVNVQSYTRRRRTISTGSGEISTAEESVSTAGASMPVSTTGMVQEASTPSSVATKDKGKAIMRESESLKKMKQREQIQIRRDEEVALKLQEEFDAAERQRMAQVYQADQGFTNAEWDDVLARVAADEDFVQQLQAGEKFSKEDLPMKLVELVNQRKKFFDQQRAKAKRNKPMTPAQQKDYMSNYIKNQEGGYSIKQLKSLSFEQRLKRTGQYVSEKPVKRQKIGEASGSGEVHSTKKEKELSQEDLQQMMMVVSVEEVYVEALQTFDDMLNKFDRDDLDKLWSLVKERFSSTDPTDDKERTLWVELKRLFEPDTDDILWKLQRYMHDPLTWRLYDTCGVHHVSTDRGHDIFMLVEKDYPLTRGLLTLMLCNKLQVDQYSEMADELLRKIVILANRPRQ
ncbi:hypothetical protein Tco_0562425 [Tanacetum coccineum]